MMVNFYQFTQCCTPIDSYLQCVCFEAVSSTAQDTTPPHITMGNCAIGYKQFLMLCSLQDECIKILWNFRIVYPMTQYNNSEDMTKSVTFKA
jgi:hypothetical protein